MTWLAALLVGSGVILLVPARPKRLAVPGRVRSDRSGETSSLTRPTAWWTSGLALGAALAVWLPGHGGPLAAAVVVLAVGLAGPRLAAASDRRSARGRLDAGLVLAADLLVAALGAGAPLWMAVEAVGRSIDGPLGTALFEASRRAQVGVDPVTALVDLSADPATARLARALGRASESGMPPRQVLAAAAESERDRRRSNRVARARVAGSLAALPLGLLFLPAFVLVVVVPLVVGSFPDGLGPTG